MNVYIGAQWQKSTIFKTPNVIGHAMFGKMFLGEKKTSFIKAMIKSIILIFLVTLKCNN